MSFAAITLCVAPQRVFIVVVYFVIDSVRKLLESLSYIMFECIVFCFKVMVVIRGYLFFRSCDYTFNGIEED
jgi:hypothetical protein